MYEIYVHVRICIFMCMYVYFLRWMEEAGRVACLLLACFFPNAMRSWRRRYDEATTLRLIDYTLKRLDGWRRGLDLCLYPI